ncbi:putative xyloglucan-specific endoglucanase [Phaeomoniella chlamydospora]|uniref:xyloglucan-specific endo-beta-1,4-glucanase n=1 Tax=Phaeomoniella chlamydospora TaxID=158046 RepID=A0A0G2EGV4_PHACM|nr:putative xyloglucan-specific endoglucanase [Phaeomoniella chlamydospora]
MRAVYVTYYENGTYPTKTVGPKFTATWQYDQGPESQPVHAFPNAKIEINEIVNASTVQLSNLTSMPVDIAWTYGSGDVVASTLDTSGLSDLELNSNVCFDMFLDSDPDKAITTDNSTYEVMIWLGQFGLSTQPIGNTLGVKATKVVNETTFDLYDGENSNTGQKVFTWLAEGNTTDFVGNIGLLLDELSSYGGPTTSDYLGYIAFGSEALYVTKNVTFSVSELSLDLQTS